MKHTLATLTLALLLIACAPGTAAATSQALSGTYQWNNGGDGPLEATFVATSDDTWDVKFVFRFQARGVTSSSQVESLAGR